MLVILEDYVFRRETDPTYGYKELVVEGAESGKK
jgi:hypothetical protein